MPRASDRVATAKKPGLRRNRRAPCLTSCQRSSNHVSSNQPSGCMCPFMKRPFRLSVRLGGRRHLNISGAAQHRQARVFRKTRVGLRKLAKEEAGAAIGDNAAYVLAARAQSGYAAFVHQPYGSLQCGMASKTSAGRTAYGAAAIRAAEAFVPEALRLFDDPLILSFLPAASRFAIRQRWIREQFLALFERQAPGIRGALLSRTCAIDDAVNAAIGRGL